MGHPEIENRTPFAFDALFVNDEEMRPIVAPVVKATFDILRGGGLELAEEQIPLSFAGECHGEPGQSSQRIEPEMAFMKPTTDIVLIGHAHAPARRAVTVDVAVRVGSLERRLRVTGDRVWRKGLFRISASAPDPFEKIPLVYERAYGGWDRGHADPEKHSFHPGNPVGIGFRKGRSHFEEESRLPNIEDPQAALTTYLGKSLPAGFGFICPHWEPRSALAGTYDDTWMRTRMPLLPRDFDRRFFNAASPGLITSRYLRGDEPVIVRGASPEGQISFRLPGIQPPASRLSFHDRADETLQSNLDTVIVDLDARKLILLWRAFTVLREGPLDVRGIEVTATNAPERRALIELPKNVVRLPARQAA